MKKYLLVEGVTDVAFVKYVCFKKNITSNFNDFKKIESRYIFENLVIINLQGQSNLNTELNYLKDEEQKIEKIAIIQDADKDFEKSKNDIKNAIQKSDIDKSKIDFFLTPNNKDLGDLERLLLSTIQNNHIINCFDDYKNCLLEKEEIFPKALNKGQLYAYTMYSQKGENLYKPQDSFIYKNQDTNLWDLNHPSFQPIVNFLTNFFKGN